jgi:peptidoglycan/LPS O-acetylase OafA/YrhL
MICVSNPQIVSSRQFFELSAIVSFVCRTCRTVETANKSIFSISKSKVKKKKKKGLSKKSQNSLSIIMALLNQIERSLPGARSHTAIVPAAAAAGRGLGAAVSVVGSESELSFTSTHCQCHGPKPGPSLQQPLSQQHPKVSSYRADVTGIRGLSVLLIVIYHINKQLIPGGFVGVDVFFVISGFLITGNIIRALSTGSFSFLEFYAARTKRIFPALAVLLAVNNVASALILLPVDIERNAWAGIAGLLSYGNFHFCFSLETGYFAEDTASVPLLHLWSLGVEEQFYLLWPVILWFAYSRKHFNSGTAIAAIVSICSAQYLYNSSPSAAYYLPSSRAGELLIGALIALCSLDKIVQHQSQLLKEICGVCGVIGIAGSAFWLSEDMIFPGFLSLYPTISAALLLLGHGSFVNENILTLRALTTLGLVSYSWYLYHWPFVAYAHVMNMRTLPLTQLSIFVYSLLAAVISWHLVETPWRRISWKPRRILVSAACVVAVISCLFAFSISQSELSSNWGDRVVGHIFSGEQALSESESAFARGLVPLGAPDPDYGQSNGYVGLLPSDPLLRPHVSRSGHSINDTLAQWAALPGFRATKAGHDVHPNVCMEGSDEHGMYKYTPGKVQPCISADFGVSDSELRDVLLVGDSHSSHYQSMLEEFSTDMGTRFFSTAASGCFPVCEQKDLHDCDSLPKRSCAKMHKHVHGNISKFRSIILAAYWQLYPSDFINNIEIMLQKMAANNNTARVLLLGQFPAYDTGFLGKRCPMFETAQHRRSPKMVQLCLKSMTLQQFRDSPVGITNAKLKDLASRWANVNYWDANDGIMCIEGTCSTYNPRKYLMYPDFHHIYYESGIVLARHILEQTGLPNILQYALEGTRTVTEQERRSIVNSW